MLGFQETGRKGGKEGGKESKGRGTQEGSRVKLEKGLRDNPLRFYRQVYLTNRIVILSSVVVVVIVIILHCLTVLYFPVPDFATSHTYQSLASFFLSSLEIQALLHDKSKFSTIV